jgi:hypothetical protein
VVDFHAKSPFSQVPSLTALSPQGMPKYELTKSCYLATPVVRATAKFWKTRSTAPSHLWFEGSYPQGQVEETIPCDKGMQLNTNYQSQRYVANGGKTCSSILDDKYTVHFASFASIFLIVSHSCHPLTPKAGLLLPTVSIMFIELSSRYCIAQDCKSSNHSTTDVQFPLDRVDPLSASLVKVVACEETRSMSSSSEKLHIPRMVT